MSWYALVLTLTLTMSPSLSIHSRSKYGQYCCWSGDSASPLWKCEYNNKDFGIKAILYGHKNNIITFFFANVFTLKEGW